ncbi:MAG: hypothetical protein ACRD12_00720 [Acidimicrobiales bacterium]
MRVELGRRVGAVLPPAEGATASDELVDGLGARAVIDLWVPAPDSLVAPLRSGPAPVRPGLPPSSRRRACGGP